MVMSLSLTTLVQLHYCMIQSVSAPLHSFFDREQGKKVLELRRNIASDFEVVLDTQDLRVFCT